MENNNKPKIENVNKGFHYTVSDGQIKAHQARTVEEIFEWLETSTKFIFSVQTPEERERAKKIKNQIV